MEIMTNEINNELDNLVDTLIADESQPASRIKTVIDAMDVIKAQSLEIRELQLVIVRLRDELLAMAPGFGTDFWAKRRMAAFKAMPEPRVSWEDFKRTWKDH